MPSLSNYITQEQPQRVVIGELSIRYNGAVIIFNIDEEDRERLAQHVWYTDKLEYGFAFIGKRDTYTKRRDRTKIYLHRFIIDAPADRELNVDHINGIKRDNRKANLRVVPKGYNSQNKMLITNTSGYIGVSWHSVNRCWRARLMKQGKEIYCSLHNERVEAAKAYDRVALEHYGADAATNVKLGMLIA